MHPIMSLRSTAQRLGYICRSCSQKRAISTSRGLRDAVPVNPESQRILLPPGPPAEHRVFKLSESRRLISIQGRDAADFLHGITTNVVPDSRNVEGLYSAFLTAQGRVLYDVFIYPTNHSRNAQLTNDSDDPAFLIDVGAELAPELLKHIRRYKLRSKFVVKAVDDFNVWSVPNSFRLEGEGEEATDHSSNLKIGCVDPRAPGMGRRVVLPADVSPSEGLVTAPDDEITYRLKRYLLGVPETPGEIMSGSGLPQESNIDYMSGINFHKGCYVGQELTIRTRHTGVVRKRILPVQLYTSPEPLEKTDSPVYDPVFGATLPVIPASGNISRVNKKGRSAGKFFGSVGNIGLALCRLEIMTGTSLGGEGPSFDPEVDEFKVDLGEGVGEVVKVKAFVPEWHATGAVTNEVL
ncbi:ccr4 associated factor [Arthrobotrys musiformis]|uniref:Iron-sulfur cluster assembly factor IBA57 homolog, mitochondrial n=1 Tax=Arthrobotrys musiformis TaxID=47236 RepID=A0AAV9WQD9_9PEZI